MAITNNDFKTNKIIIATGNKGKFTEISNILYALNVHFESPDNYNIKEPVEDGNSFEENSIIKAKYYAKMSNMIAIADDSGFSIPDLDNQPGIYSSRFAYNEETKATDFTYAFNKINSMLKQKNIDLSSKIKAFFTCNITIYNPFINKYKSFEARVDGTLCNNPRGKLGFGYDPIFIRDNDNLTFGEMEPEIKDQISHRAIAIKELLNFLLN
jgi:XTP/dITP diphosphohydrolase